MKLSKFRVLLIVSLAFVATRALAGCAASRIMSYSPQFDQEPAPGQHETPIQSVSGKVVDISSTQLRLEVQADGKTDTIEFIIDENTKTDGDIKSGIMATVDYNTKEGKKYAAHIMPAEAKKP
jgi:hypothetical protein